MSALQMLQGGASSACTILTYFANLQDMRRKFWRTGYEISSKIVQGLSKDVQSVSIVQKPKTSKGNAEYVLCQNTKSRKEKNETFLLEVDGEKCEKGKGQRQKGQREKEKKAKEQKEKDEPKPVSETKSRFCRNAWPVSKTKSSFCRNAWSVSETKSSLCRNALLAVTGV